MSILQPGCSLSNHLTHAKSIDICARCHLYAVSSVGDVICTRCHPEEGDSPPRDLTKRLQQQHSRQDRVRWMHCAFPTSHF
jgi:hypothetical protein